MTTTAGPYAAAALLWTAAGWPSVLPLPYGKKFPPPAGFTGRAGVDPASENLEAWVETRGGGNAALRLPADVVGLDVDDYDDKPGRTTLQAYTERCGPLPSTWRISNRGTGLSGIYLFRCPPGTHFVGELEGKGVEVIQRTHRFAVLPPSVHPSGRVYVLYGPDGELAAVPPLPWELPELPPAWVEALRRAEKAPTSTKASPGSGKNGKESAASTKKSVSPADTQPARPATPSEPPCPAALRRYDQASKAATGNDRHNTMLAPLMRLVQAYQDGHHGVVALLEQLKEEYAQAVQDARECLSDAREEFDRMADGPQVPKRKPHAQYSTCSCDIAGWEAELARPDAFTGREARLQKRIMQSLVREAKKTHSRRVKKSTRQIAEDAESTPRTVAKHLHALHAQGRFQVLSRGLQATEVVLTRVPATTARHEEEERRSTAVVAGTLAPTHPLFGSMGLRGNQELTFNVLDLYLTPRGPVTLLGLRRGHRGPLGQSRSWRRLAGRSRRGGLTAKRVSELNRLPVATVRKHLKQLKKVGLAAKIDGLWFRLHFDADTVAAEWDVDEVPAKRQARHVEERRALWRARSELPEDDARRVVRIEAAREIIYTHPDTGEVKWSYRIDE